MKEKLQQILAPLAQKLPFLQKYIGQPPAEDLDDSSESTGVHEVAEVASDLGDKTDPGIVVPVDDSFEENKSIFQKILSKFKKPQESGMDTSESSEEAQPKKKLKPIHIAIIVIILGAVLLSDEEKAPEVVDQKPTQIKPRKKIVQEEAQSASVATEEPIAETTVIDETPTVEPVTEPVAKVEPTPTPDSTPVSPIENPGAAQGLEDLTTGIKLDEDDDGQGTIKDDQLPVAQDPIPTTKVSQEGLKELEEKVAEKKEKRKKSPQVDYVSPPDYEMPGRGLVYSCKGKHWACVSGAGYGQCEKNNDYNKQHKEKIECFPSNVYMTDEDCARAQMEKINEGFNIQEICKI